jgi:hypothetical protein
MERRRFLAALAGGVSASLAGCYALRPTRPPPAVRDVDRIPPAGEPFDGSDGEVVASHTVGPEFSPTIGEHRPHEVALRNATDTARAFECRVVRWGGAELLATEGVLSPDDRVRVTLRGPANYSVVVRAGDVVGRLDVEQSTFDCNRSWSTVAIRDGRLTETTIATQMACGWAWP